MQQRQRQPHDGLRLKPQPKLSTPPLFANGIQEPGNAFLFRHSGAIEVLAHDERELVLAYAVLSGDFVQWGVIAGGSVAGGIGFVSGRGLRAARGECSR